MTKRWIERITLTGSKVIVEPLAFEHADGLRDAVKDGGTVEVVVYVHSHAGKNGRVHQNGT